MVTSNKEIAFLMCVKFCVKYKRNQLGTVVDLQVNLQD